MVPLYANIETSLAKDVRFLDSILAVDEPLKRELASYFREYNFSKISTHPFFIRKAFGYDVTPLRFRIPYPIPLGSTLQPADHSVRSDLKCNN